MGIPRYRRNLNFCFFTLIYTQTLKEPDDVLIKFIYQSYIIMIILGNKRARS